MEIIKFGKAYHITATSRQIILSVFFAALCGGLTLSIASVSCMYYINGTLAYQTAENKAMISRVQGEARNLALEVTTCERRIEACLNTLKARKK